MSVDSTSRVYDLFKGVSTQRQKSSSQNGNYCVTITMNRINELRTGNSRATICRCEMWCPQHSSQFSWLRAPSGSPLRALGTSLGGTDDSQHGRTFYSSKWPSLGGSWLRGLGSDYDT